MELKRLTNIALNNDYIPTRNKLIKPNLFFGNNRNLYPGFFIKEKVKTSN